ncbi:MAG: hypothetical protein K8R75_02260, partial [Deltaproteobacteria bacterium]|nr:hypothetical protein [Deltaproteobacteria bacterium]
MPSKCANCWGRRIFSLIGFPAGCSRGYKKINPIVFEHGWSFNDLTLGVSPSYGICNIRLFTICARTTE